MLGFMGLRVLVVSALVVALVGCGSARRVSAARPFVVEYGGNGAIAMGPDTSAWGDTDSTYGCIDGRRFAVAFVIRNRSKHTATLLGSPAVEFDRSIARVAVQFAPQPPTDGHSPPMNDPQWSRHASAPLAVPAGRDAWVQSSLLMSHCSLLGPQESLTVNRTIALDYREGGDRGTEVINFRDAALTLTRGPTHLSVPINGSG
jgi:hypothetical protein